MISKKISINYSITNSMVRQRTMLEIDVKKKLFKGMKLIKLENNNQIQRSMVFTNHMKTVIVIYLKKTKLQLMNLSI